MSLEVPSKNFDNRQNVVPIYQIHQRCLFFLLNKLMMINHRFNFYVTVFGLELLVTFKTPRPFLLYPHQPGHNHLEIEIESSHDSDHFDVR